MRFILFAAAGLAALAIAAAAPAKPGGSGSGQGSGPVGWSNGGGHHGGKGVRTRLGIGPVRWDGPRGRHHRRHGRDRGGDYRAYDGGGIAGPVGEAGRYGNGFFTGGGQVRAKGGRAHFDYDRAYPYEFASVAGGREPEWEEAQSRAAPRARCTMESGVRVCRGW